MEHIACNRSDELGFGPLDAGHRHTVDRNGLIDVESRFGYGAAGFYVEHRNLGAAVEHLEEVVLVDTAAFGPDDPLIGDSLFYIAGLYRELDRLDDAARAYQAALAVYEKFLPPDHADIGWLSTEFAQVLERLGDPVRAAEMTARAAATKFGRPDG